MNNENEDTVDKLNENWTLTVQILCVNWFKEKFNYNLNSAYHASLSQNGHMITDKTGKNQLLQIARNNALTCTTEKFQGKYMFKFQN